MFPVHINQISKFEKNNADISANVSSTAKQPDDFHILYSSQNPNRLHRGKPVTFRIEQS